MYTPSASRVLDWFFTLGFDGRAQEQLRDEDGNTLRLTGLQMVERFLAERAMAQAGVTVHFPLPDTWLWGALPPMVHVRAGVATDEFRVLTQPRVVFEAGIGVF